MHISKEKIINKARELGYFIKKGYSNTTIIGLKNAIDEYIRNINDKPSLTKLSSKYGIGRELLSK
jgi:hypothetical protein